MASPTHLRGSADTDLAPQQFYMAGAPQMAQGFPGFNYGGPAQQQFGYQQQPTHQQHIPQQYQQQYSYPQQ